MLGISEGWKNRRGAINRICSVCGKLWMGSYFQITWFEFDQTQPTAAVWKHSSQLFFVFLFFKTLQPLSAANAAVLCLHKGTLLHVTLPRKRRLISLKTSFLISSLLTLVSLRLSMHPQWAGLTRKERTQVKETWLQFKRLEMYPVCQVWRSSKLSTLLCILKCYIYAYIMPINLC